MTKLWVKGQCKIFIFPYIVLTIEIRWMGSGSCIQSICSKVGLLLNDNWPKHELNNTIYLLLSRIYIPSCG